MVKSFKLNSYAKINLTLEILGRRKDGFHEISSIFQTINLYDTIHFQHSSDFTVSTNIESLNNEDNLVYQAGILLKEYMNVKFGANILVDKNIPISAGLGGGSSNAAVTLIGLSKLWGLNIKFDQLVDLASRIGSDVSFFLSGGTSQVSGKGEMVSKLPSIKEMKIILIFIDQYPKFSELNHSKTALAYSFLSKKNYTDGKYTNDLATIIEGNVQPYYSNFFNAFSDVYLDVFCDIKNPFTSLNNMGIFKFCVAGSGPTLFIPICEDDDIDYLVKKINEIYGFKAIVTSFISE